MERTRSFPTRTTTTRKMGAALAFIGVLTGAAAHAETVTVGIGTQNTTTNTVTGGIVIEKLGLMEKYL
ncbi:MAG: ABC transporter substrate-binding protein, partial [Gammaproteobacteria bacterium]|nr:ABC transporter substrate-binding protein [Gammaproteobacteria bacterium]